MKTINWSIHISIIIVIIFGCNQLSEYSTDSKVYTTRQEEEAILCTPGNTIETTGLKDAGRNGHLKITGPQNELHISADKFQIIPVLGLGTWAAFTPYQDSSMIIGDILITGTDLASVQQEVGTYGLTITDIHQYSTLDRSVIVYMHIIGFGSNAKLLVNANALSSRLKKTSTKNQKEEKVNSVKSILLRTIIDSIIGYKGEIRGDVYQHTIDRRDTLKSHEVSVSKHLEFNTWAAWQITGENTVVAGGISMLKNEVGPVIKALAENGFELVHNQLVNEERGIFLLHYWGVGRAEKLAIGLRAALNQQE